MTDFLGRSPILSLALLVGMPPAFAQIVSAQSPPEPDKTAQEKPDEHKQGFVTSEKNKALQDYVIKNVYPLTAGATILDYKISSQYFRVLAADTTSDPDRVYNALKKITKDTLETLKEGTDHFTDGNMRQLAADAREMNDCHWDGYKEGTPPDNLPPDPNFGRQQWGEIQNVITYKSTWLPDGRDMLAVLQQDDEAAIFTMLQDSYVESSGAKTKADKELVRQKTAEDATAYVANEIAVWKDLNMAMAGGVTQTFLGKDGTPRSVGEIMTEGAQNRGLIMAVGEQTADESIFATVLKTPRTNSRSSHPNP